MYQVPACEYNIIHCMLKKYCLLLECVCFQTVLDWQNKEQLPVKAPDNELFTVKYSEVHLDSAM